MSRKKKHAKHEEHMDESWLLPYADLLTLLLALFIVLFSMSKVDAQKFKQLSSSFRNEFTGGKGVLEEEHPVKPVETPQEDDAQSTEMKNLEEVQEKISDYIAKNDLKSKLQTRLTDEGLLVSILNDVLFDSSSAIVRKQDEEFVQEVSQLLVMDFPRSIVISGHTDNIPISNANFASNWELSVMRAINFMKILMKNNQLDPKTFSAKGYGEYKPAATNETDEGKQKNRRVEILILPNTVEVKE